MLVKKILNVIKMHGTTIKINCGNLFGATVKPQTRVDGDPADI
jgi:hypothetical protein